MHATQPMKEREIQKASEKVRKRVAKYEKFMLIAALWVQTFQDPSRIQFSYTVVAANFRNHGRNHSRIHSRQVSSESLSDVSMWDDWIVKYVNEDNKKTIVAEDSPMEEWIFETM
ncbi:14261_t:CDS:2 [Funneliformis geosporum]|uniref:14261_t:CDS:1 n=1 Tax=Funneliformis geosporum TaxID=1117311 RepID=A0A9W4SBB8_9GLOM|nr:14261_t:CDS:2 [Funneliformis geosporum]